MFLEPNTKVTIKELMKGLIIQSGNDASVAISQHIATGEKSFSDIMNYYAKILGMFNTNFVNSTGIPNIYHYTTARDLAILSKYVIKDFPISYNLYSKKSYTFNKIKQINIPIFEYTYQNYRIWGATAAIISSLCSKIRDE